MVSYHADSDKWEKLQKEKSLFLINKNVVVDPIDWRNSLGFIGFVMFSYRK